MGDKRRIVQQWLETDAALGAAEVPFPSRRRRGAKVAAAPLSGAMGDLKGPTYANAAVASAAASVPAVRNFVPPKSMPASVRPTTPVAAKPAVSAASVPVAKPRKSVEMPPAPADDIAALPVLSRGQKLERLEKLRLETEALLTPYLNEVATRIVFGEGDVDAPIFFVGEGPGIEEDRTGRPFVGKSGGMLDKWIASIGFTREQMYIGNVVKLRAAELDEATQRLKDRPPTPEEVARGIHVLHAQIECVRPRAIVTVGAPALKWLAGSTEGLMKIRGTWLKYRGIPLMPTYHPAFLLRAYTAENRKKVWDDLKAVAQRIKET